MSFKNFEEKTRQAISEMRSEKVKEITLIHHVDADALSAAVITKICLEREGYKIKTLCLEKMYPEVIESIHSTKGKIIFYADIGSAHADYISKCNAGKNLTIILDHHDPTEATDPEVYDLNLEHYGYKGETDFSGSTSAYLFATALNEKNKDLAPLSLVGSSEIPEGFLGINKSILDEAVKSGVLIAKGKQLQITKLKITVSSLFSALQILGPVGYYTGGPELGIKACIEGLIPEIKKELDKLENDRKAANKKLLSKLYREGLNETENIQWFDSEDTYKGMGSKVIGTFCSFLSFQTRIIKSDKYIVGFTNMSPEIPGWGKLKENFIKASIRIPRDMQKLIDQKQIPSAVDLLIEASKGFGVADGHLYAANVILPADKKEVLIINAEKFVSTFKASVL
jgi:single-stranded-DNA-specific exonuclease